MFLRWENGRVCDLLLKLLEVQSGAHGVKRASADVLDKIEYSNPISYRRQQASPIWGKGKVSLAIDRT